MSIAGLVVALLACALAFFIEAAGPAVRARLGRGGPELLVFTTGSLAIALSVLHVSAATAAWPTPDVWVPPAILLVGWVLLRALTRAQEKPGRLRLAAACVLVAVGVAHALARIWRPEA